MRILLADDDRATRIRLGAYLTEWGHDVHAAADGNEAWEMYQADHPWIIVSDWNMPGLSGIEFVRRVRETVAPAEYVYVILLTSRSEKADLVAGMEAGADDFVAKPFDKEELRVRIRAGERVIQLERILAERNTQLTSINLRMRESMQAAARIQRAFLPPEHGDYPGCRTAWRYRPCDELAGDTMNILRLDDEHIAFYVADVCGHGVAASLLSITLSRMLSKGTGADDFLLRRSPTGHGQEAVAPAKVARRLNERFPWNPMAMEYFTLFYAVLGCRKRELRYVCAGHPRPLLIRSNAPPERLHSDPPAIGLLPDAEFPGHTVQLGRGDRIYAFTDGLIETLSPDGEEFGEERLMVLAAEAQPLALDAGLRGLMDAVEAWRGGHGPTDDQCAVAIEVA